MSAHHRVSLTLRLFYLALILVAVWNHAWGSVFLNAFLFIATLFLHELGKRDARYFALDAYAIGVFAGSMLFGITGLYTALNDGSILGVDKLFHLLGGAGLAWFGLLWWDHELKGWREWVQVLALTLTLGIGWELFELTLAVLPAAIALPHNGLADSCWDLVADMIGGLVVCLIWFRKRNAPAEQDMITVVKRARAKRKKL